VVDKVQLEPSTLLYPVPVVLVSCGDIEGNPNIITIGWTGIVCSDPPMVSISIRPHRYSAKIIKESMEFVINIPTEDMLEKTDQCGVISGSEHDKFGEIGLTPVRAKEVKVPLIDECPVNLECVVKDIIPLGAHDLYIAEVVAASADEDVVQDGKISVSKAKPLVFCPVDSTYWNLESEVGSYAFTAKKGS
jgi:flavin reductase (DIM6/NTAB) family NADH-FMN oxidoreductase RutF